MAKRRANGTGSLIRNGRFWWIKYYEHGRPRRENTHTDNKSDAQRVLNDRLGRLATGQPILPRAHQIRYQELREDLWRHYETTGSRQLPDARTCLNHLDGFFTQLFLISAMRAGTTSWQSPTTPNREWPNMEAARSVLTETMAPALAHPAMCWGAPEMPSARYRSGDTILPESPIW